MNYINYHKAHTNASLDECMLTYNCSKCDMSPEGSNPTQGDSLKYSTLTYLEETIRENIITHFKPIVIFFNWRLHAPRVIFQDHFCHWVIYFQYTSKFLSPKKALVIWLQPKRGLFLSEENSKIFLLSFLNPSEHQ